MVAEINIIAI